MEIKPTQRAYTLRLRGADKDDSAWRDNLWKTHEAVNKGAKVFGDWLLTLRGGLDHRLADTKDKRILLALSWLSVESNGDQPNDLKVVTGKDTDADRKRWLEGALQNILEGRGIADQNEISAWLDDCSLSLQAAIREEDAVWINRSGAFDKMCNGLNIPKARKDAQTLLWHLFSDDYLVLPTTQKKSKKKSFDDQNSEELSEEELDEEKSNIVVKSGKSAGQKTRHPFSHIFGFKEDSAGFGKSKQKLELKDNWKQSLKPFIDSSGIPLADIKQLKRKNDEASPTELQREMFSKAASRLAQIHTKQKQQEVEREQRKTADEELKELEYTPAYEKAIELLKDYCKKYGESTGSLREFQIQRRQITKWDRVVDAWAKISDSDPDTAEEKRIEEAKRLQEEFRDDKFGDINLFIRLADDKYKPVWTDASILKTFVKGMKARSDAKHLKVAAYRHPDPYFNPVFCQFGNSRPKIEFERLKKKPTGDIRKVEMLLWDGNRATTLTPLLAVGERFDKDFGSRCENAEKAESLPLVPRRDRLALAMIGQSPENVRVTNIFDLKEKKKRPQADSDNNDKDTKPKEPEWNGTLQADRSELERIGKMKTDQFRAEKLVRQLKWWLIVSMELQPHGPWEDYIKNSVDKRPFERIYKSGKNKGQRYLSYEGWPHDKENENREFQAKLILSRLPDLRILSVDLGHRYAAACAVWETLSKEQMENACRASGVSLPSENEIYRHLKSKTENGNEKTTIYRRIGSDTLPDGSQHPAPWARLDRQFLIKLQGEEKEGRMATLDEIWQVHELEKELGLRRPLIDRLVKAGWGNNGKQPKMLEEFTEKGWKPSPEATNSGEDEEESFWRRQSLSVDDLMSSAVDTVRLALKRHGDRARIAHYLTTDVKPGKDEKLDDKGRIEIIADALELWYGLATSKSWKDKFAEETWEKYFPDIQLSKGGNINKTRQQIKKDKKDYREQTLRPQAEQLAKNKSLCMKLHAQWDTRWREDDGIKAKTEHEEDSHGNRTGKDKVITEATGWHKRLRQLQDWIVPYGIRKVYKDDTGKWKTKVNKKVLNNAMNVGGLSLLRMDTLREFRRKVQVAFFTRLHPNGTKETIKERFGQGTLDTLEQMQEQRVKQLASRIVEAALGVGSENPKHWEDGKKRPQKPPFTPCHAVVIENLNQYRTKETRTKRENRMLAVWSQATFKKHLANGCQLHGLHRREVPAGYTSRQDSRTGAPGVRCTDVPVNDFLNSAYWKNEVKRATKVKDSKEDSVYYGYIRDLSNKWANASDEDKKKAIRIPRKGGEIFVSVNGNSIQADLSAAANIGLKALLDPDWQGSWWYVPAELDDEGWRIPKDKSCAGTECLKNWKMGSKDNSYTSDGKPLALGDDESVKKAEEESKKAKVEWDAVKKAAKKNKTDEQVREWETQAKKAYEAAKKKLFEAKKAASAKENINLWRDVSSNPLTEGNWQEFTPYWRWVNKRVVEILQKSANICA